MGRVQGKVALITGAAKGIGKEAALLLAREGAKLAVTDFDEAEGRKVAEAIAATGGEALFMKQDVADEAQWQAVIASTLARFGRLDILVNNAGVALAGSVEETSLEDWRWLMSINLDAVFLGTKHGILAMKGNGGGSIINISSIEGIIADPNLAAYNASKGGVRIFSKSAALHCAKSGYKIRVNSVHPGYIWTPMVEGYLNETEDPAAGKEGLVSLHPIGRLGVASDIANGILYLASDESSFMTGSELVIDGGYTAQ
ncbi:glucose 1-dehydrogenase [Zavarzinia aquatilis]|uniref:3-beta hydroxysteroid dehydrogenase n=1 Tax=Zavarzinia aquatilis TaxID=2211142 RepID=A0A317E3D9_9PROT|nr:glucose 1-dehydrogenase [Zavarzinia aquatilis]PWR21112.1 3-beta hydroxysteroid dehydrogenase [Zavarzinia aquatilis]